MLTSSTLVKLNNGIYYFAYFQTCYQIYIERVKKAIKMHDFKFYGKGPEIPHKFI